MFVKKNNPSTHGVTDTTGTTPNNSPAKKMGAKNLNKSGMKHSAMSGKAKRVGNLGMNIPPAT